MIKKIDHMVITVRDFDECIAFYTKIGFEVRRGADRVELYAGDFKINVHMLHHELSPHAQCVTLGAQDICFEVDDLDGFVERLEKANIAIEQGIVPRTGVNGAMQSVYIRDPEGNLLEFSQYYKPAIF